MFSRQEASKLRQEFWTTFGKYMNPVLSSDGEKINWINYKTGKKDIAFRMDADKKTAFVAIELTHSDREIQQIYFEQFLQLKNIFHESVNEEWIWQLHSTDNSGKSLSRIFVEKTGCSVYKKEDWPELISFFKPRIIGLDDFWSSAKYTFELLR